MKVLRLIFESFRFALSALRGNLTRTILSLLGVTVGIFAIIAVFTLVDSLENSIKDSFSFLGSNNINVQKWPWGFGGGEYEWWEFMKRPQPELKEYEFLDEHLTSLAAITAFSDTGGRTLKAGSNSISDCTIIGAHINYDDVYDIKIATGRYLTTQEIDLGKSVCLIGEEVADALFPNGNSIGSSVKVQGRKHIIVGIFEHEGESFLGEMGSKDNTVLVPYNSYKKMFYLRSRFGMGTTITAKGLDTDIGLVELENEARGLLRSFRGLKPKDKDNFALNKSDALAEFIGSTFDVVSLAGTIIGMFSILVGGFGIANIMFVSVKERTNIIGIQKSLGAKNYFILFQFLFEAIFLSLIGALVGLILVYLITFIPLGSLKLTLSISNVTIGLAVAIVIGLVSGIVPAALAARLDPVIAIRSK